MAEMTHTDIRKALGERVAALLESTRTFPKPPRPYQLEAFRSIGDWLADPSGNKRCYVEQATGLGKTFLFAALAGFCTDLRVLVVVPTRILVEQTIKETVKFTGGVLGYMASIPDIKDDEGRVVGMRGDFYSNIVVTTDESLIAHPERLSKGFKPHLIIFDECHWGYTGRAKWALRYFPDSAVIGFSATPDFLTTQPQEHYLPVTLENGQMLYAEPDRLASMNFGTLVDKRSAFWGVNEGWLSPLAWGQVRINMSLDNIPMRRSDAAGYDFSEEKLALYMSQHWSNITNAVGQLYEYGEYNIAGKQTFAVCPSIRAAEDLAKSMNDRGVPSACISSRTSTGKRREMLKAYAANQIRLLTSVMVLREGWDAPNAEICLMFRPTKSIILYMQTVGRILRPQPDKVALVLDGDFYNTVFKPLSAPALFAPVGRDIHLGDVIIQAKTDAPGPATGIQTSPYLLGPHSTRHKVERFVVGRA